MIQRFGINDRFLFGCVYFSLFNTEIDFVGIIRRVLGNPQFEISRLRLFLHVDAVESQIF